MRILGHNSTEKMNPIYLRRFILLLTAPLLFAGTNNSFISANEDHVEALVSWFKAENGIFNDKAEIRKVDPNKENSRYGVFATGYIGKGELIFRLPHSIVMSTGKPRLYVPLECDIVRILAKELELGNKSKYAPYVNFLLKTEAPGHLPSAWSDAGKELLHDVLGYDTKEPLPPSDATTWITEDWHIDCGGSDDFMEEFAAELVVQRSWDNLLLPVYDILAHRNGHWFNTIGEEPQGDNPIQVFASRDIRPGEEIYGSQNLCEDCGSRHTSYGTPELMRDYGFVEQFPQRWIFHEYGVAFEIDEIYRDGQATDEYVLKEWIGKKPLVDGIDKLRDRIAELNDDIKYFLGKRDPKVPENEWNVVHDYANAMHFAASFAIDIFEKDECPEGSCAYLPGYRDLNKETELFTEESYTQFTCDNEVVMARLDEEPYEELETIRSHYQKFTFFWNKETKACCFDIENTVQICDDYRPHYHEMSVHYAARYLANPPRRVIFVGGGDSLLLHEVLKYPSVELVVGLEIDQKVVRYSFKHFGSQPHFNNEKVQWWFGDASKSLLMLPRDYFGSFDLVLIDLSETITSNAVTEELDILGALALLVKPDGIILKNEVYFLSFASMFKHSVMVNWYDNPIICSQVMSMGSNTVDFLNPTLKDYNVETLFLKDLKEIDNNFELYHDYAKNITSSPVCYTNHDEDTTQVRSPGVLMILEAENTSANLANADALKHVLTTALEREGITIVSTDVAKFVGSKAFVTIVLREGYVVARTEPDHDYCGFDIHFWGSFHKQESVKRALIEAVKAERKDSSVFRIIAGGMFGVSTWKDDEKRRGPSTIEGCNDNADTVAYKAKQSSINNAIGEITKLIKDEKLKVAVLCGDDTATCESNSDALKKKKNIAEVVTLSCPMMKDFNEFVGDAKDIMDSCGSHLVESMKVSLKSGAFNVLILDSTVNKFIASVLLKTFKSRKDFGDKVYDVLEEDKSIILSAMSDNSEEWRANFLKEFKEKTFYYDPAVYAEVALYKSVDDDFKLLLVCEKNDIVNELKDVTKLLEKETGLQSEVRIVNGGMWLMQHDFQASHSYSPKDYDQTSALQQWKSQQPIALQVVAQMETKTEGSLSEELLMDAVDRALARLSPPTRLSSYNDIDVHQFDHLGDGSIFFASWSGGSVVVLWDGREHVDVNLFAYEGLESQVKEFEKWFQRGTSLSTVLYDEHPRGYGKAVSYKHGFVAGVTPHWA